MDIQEVASFADYFVICTGTSDRMLEALAKAVLDEVRDKYKIHARLEGQPQSGWVVADMGDIVLHMFSPDQRDSYKLEQLWSDGKVLVRLQ